MMKLRDIENDYENVILTAAKTAAEENCNSECDYLGVPALISREFKLSLIMFADFRW